MKRYSVGQQWVRASIVVEVVCLVGDQTELQKENAHNYQIILIYCVCADLPKALQHTEDVECQISEAELMTAIFGGGKHKIACDFLQEQKYIPQMIRKSQFSRWLRSVHYCW